MSVEFSLFCNLPSFFFLFPLKLFFSIPLFFSVLLSLYSSPGFIPLIKHSCCAHCKHFFSSSPFIVVKKNGGKILAEHLSQTLDVLILDHF